MTSDTSMDEHPSGPAPSVSIPKSVPLPPATKRVVALLLLAAVLVLVSSSDQTHRWLLQVLAFVEGIIRTQPVLGVIAFVLFAAASAMLAFLSSAVIIPVGVYTWGQTTTVFLIWLGWILGGMFAYSLSRFVGRSAVEFLKLQPMLQRFESSVSRSTPFPVILALQVAMPSELVGYLLGFVRYPLAKYLAALALAELPYALANVYLGSSFLERRMPQLIATIVGLAIFSTWTLRFLGKRLKS